MLVDLPGYGFAKVPDKVKRKWGNLNSDYILASQDKRALTPQTRTTTRQEPAPSLSPLCSFPLIQSEDAIRCDAGKSSGIRAGANLYPRHRKCRLINNVPAPQWLPRSS